MPQLVADDRFAMLDEGAVAPDAESPELTELTSGGFVATWEVDNALVAQLYDASGAPIGLPFEVAAGGSGASLSPTSSGGFVVAWADSWQGVVVRIFDAAGGTVTTSIISDAAGPDGIAAYGRYQQPSVAVLSSGNFVVAFTAGDDGNAAGVRAQLFDADGEVIGEEFAVNTVTLANQVYPRAVSLPDGRFFISWADDFNGYGAQLFDADGNRIGGQIDIAPDAYGVFDIAVLESGNIVIVWPNENGELRAQIYGAGGSEIGSEIAVNRATGGVEILPDITALPSGGFAVAWRSPTAGVNFFEMGDIRAQVFDGAGNRVGEEIVIDSGHLGQSDPQIVSFGSGDLAISYLEYSSGAESSLQMRLLFSTQQGTAGADNLSGGNDSDFISAGAGDDILTGGAGDDFLAGGSGADTMSGSSGDDIYAVGEAGDLVTELAGEGIDTVESTISYILGDEVENLTLSGVGSLSASGNGLANTFVGNAGANLINGSAGTDTMEYSRETGSLAIYVNLSADQQQFGSGVSVGPSQARDSFGAVDTLISIERVITGAGDDHVIGTGQADYISTGSGNDALVGGAGADTLVGGTGSDLYYVTQSDGDVVVETADGGFGDEVRTADALFTLADLLHIENLRGLSGSGQTLIGNSGYNQIWGSSGADLLLGGDGGDNLDGGSGADTLDGGTGDDVLFGGGGDDILDGGADWDVMFGGTGDDTYIVDEIWDQVSEDYGDGIDTVEASVTFFLFETWGGGATGVENLSLTGSDDISGFGNEDANRIIGNSGSNWLSGDAGDDLLDGRAGADTLEGYNGADVLSGGAGADTLTGGSDADIFRDTVGGLSGDTITDFSFGDRIIISDAHYADFSFSLNGSTLTFTGGSVTLQSAFSGTLVATAAAGGGVQLAIADAVRNDFNGDGRSDILWRHESGQMINWLGQANGGFVSNADANAGTDWIIASTGDFNGDGRSDILWRNADGSLTDWLGQANGSFASNFENAYYQVNTSWAVAGSGDFNGDGRDDILWRHSTGAMINWLGQANGGFVSNADANAGTDWHVASIGDFNGDGRDDILWRNDSGAVTNWLGTASGSYASNFGNAYYEVDNGWAVAGTGDFNGDGRDDILWRHESGQIINWLGQANGGFVSNADANAGTDWNIASIGDFNGDGRDDILWRNDDGSLTNWLGQANGSFASNFENAYYQVSNSWDVQPVLDNLV